MDSAAHTTLLNRYMSATYTALKPEHLSQPRDQLCALSGFGFDSELAAGSEQILGYEFPFESGFSHHDSGNPTATVAGHWGIAHPSTRHLGLVKPQERASRLVRALAGTHGDAFCDEQHARIHFQLQTLCRSACTQRHSPDTAGRVDCRDLGCSDSCDGDKSHRRGTDGSDKGGICEGIHSSLVSQRVPRTWLSYRESCKGHGMLAIVTFAMAPMNDLHSESSSQSSAEHLLPLGPVECERVPDWRVGKVNRRGLR
jgi:hypothetical protein